MFAVHMHKNSRLCCIAQLLKHVPTQPASLLLFKQEFIACSSSKILIPQRHHQTSGRHLTVFGNNFKARFSNTAIFNQASVENQAKALNEKRQKYHKWYQTSSEFKVISTVFIAIGSYLVSATYEKKRAIKDIQLEHVNEQIKLLYGPLYGNRLVQEKTYRAVMGEHGGLKRYLKKAKDTNDAEMLRSWRSFMYNVLYPLDAQAEELLSQNSHLIADHEFPVAFDHFLNHVAKLKFLMERWKTDDGKLESSKDFTPDDFLEENNASGDRGVKEMLEHVEKKYKELRKLQKKLKVEVRVEENGEHNIVQHVVKKFM